MVAKDFFAQHTKAKIKRKDFVESTNLADVRFLEENQFTIFEDFLPQGYLNYRKFLKHGPEVKLKRFESLDEAVRIAKPPVFYRKEAFDSIDNPFKSGYTFLPLFPYFKRQLFSQKTIKGLNIDSRKRKVSLVECLEGARIYSYVHQMQNIIRIKPYADSKKVRIEGAEIIAEVPSRTKRGRGTTGMRMQFKLSSVPYIDSLEKYAIAQNLGSDHTCGSKRFNIRYRYSDDKETSGIVNICAHEIAAYLQVIDDEWNKNQNIIPLQMSQFAIPSQETVDYYLRWENNVLIRDHNIKSADKLKKPSHFHKEIALWALVKELGHDRTFYSDKSRDDDLRDYDWI